MVSMTLSAVASTPGRDLVPEDVAHLPWSDLAVEVLDGMLTVSRSTPFTWVDLREIPDDLLRYETIDGVLYVTNTPSTCHQRAVRKLSVLLDELCPPELEPFFAPFAVRLADDTEIQPDVLLAPDGAVREWGLLGAPLLAVEALSPSTRRYDLREKKDRLARAECLHYWIVDPDEPSIVAWELVEGEYVEVGRAVGEEALVLERPFKISVTPQRLAER